MPFRFPRFPSTLFEIIWGWTSHECLMSFIFFNVYAVNHLNAYIAILHLAFQQPYAYCVDAVWWQACRIYDFLLYRQYCGYFTPWKSFKCRAIFLSYIHIHWCSWCFLALQPARLCFFANGNHVFELVRIKLEGMMIVDYAVSEKKIREAVWICH